jgi:uncharacterized protein YidB (DUF937 family)
MELIDELLENVKEETMSDIISKFGLDESKAQEIIDIAGGSTKEIMTDKVKSGSLATVVNIFSYKENGKNENGVISSIQDNFITKITSQMGIDLNTAESIADTVIPKITNMITNKNQETPSSHSSTTLSRFAGDSMNSQKDPTIDKLKALFKT